jgi:hypothetical protein
LIKLCVQLLVRHLNHITELFQAKEKKTRMTTAIVLRNIEELTRLQTVIHAKIIPQIASNLTLQPAVAHLDQATIAKIYVAPLFDEEIAVRFDLVMQPCIAALSQKVQ